MKVLILHSDSISSYPSGEYIVARNESSALSNLGIDTHFEYFSYPGRPEHPLARKIHALLIYLWSPQASLKIRSLCKSYKPDIIHFHGIFPYLSASALFEAHSSGAIVVQTLHNGRWLCLEGGFYRNGHFCDKCVKRSGFLGVIYGCKNGFLASLMCFAGTMSARFKERLFSWVDHFIAVSDFIRDQHILSGFPPSKITVKNNSIDYERLRSFARPMQRQGFTFIGRISIAKGTNILRVLISEFPSTPIHIIGDGPDLEALKEFCAKRHATNVRFWGKQPQEACFHLISSSIFTILPSQCGEAFPMSAVESVGLSVPVIGSDVGGLGPFLKKSGGGIAVSPEDYHSFVSAASFLLQNPNHAKDIGLQGSSYVQNSLDANILTQELLDLYNQLYHSRHN